MKRLLTLARLDPSILLVAGDLGYGVLDNFADELPNQYLNLGVTEQSSVSICAGLASQGYRPFYYSIANFPTFRCLEQIRNDVCYMNLPVTIVSVGSGFAYSKHGYTHHALEDISIMRTLMPENIYAPYSPETVIECLDAILAKKTPSYLRLGNLTDASLEEKLNAHKIVEQKQSHASLDVHILALGSISTRALNISEALNSAGVTNKLTKVSHMSEKSIMLEMLSTKARLLVTLEDHVIVGGFGSLVLETIANNCLDLPKVLMLGLSKLNVAGQNQEELWDIAGLSVGEVVGKIRKRLNQQI